MRRPLAGGLSVRAGRGRLLGALGAIGAVALAIGLFVGAELPGSSSGASQRAKAAGATTVQRRDLVATDTESGTLSYANPHTVFNRLSGTITSLPSVGQVIKPGQTLYQVDGAPVVLLSGTVPAYRSLSEGVSDGGDVQELKQNLIALGFDPGHAITVNETFDSATTAAVERWQASLGESQTGSVALGQVVFLPGRQRITSIDTVLGSTGGGTGSGSGSGSSGSSGSGSGSAGSGSAGSGSAGSGSSASGSTGASTTVAAPRPEFVSLTSTTGKTPAAAPARCKQPTRNLACKQPSGSSSSLAALLALLKAETLELQKSRSSSASPAAGGKSAGGSSAASGGARSGGGSAGSGGGSAGSGASSGSSGAASGATSSAQAILQTTSTQTVVTVQLDATKQTEALVGDPVTVQLPNGSTTTGRITEVSPVAQSSSSSSSSSGGAGAGASSTPSATVPVTIALAGRQRVSGLDQAAVSVNFEQHKASNVLSVPVTALLATPGGGYAVQSASAPHALLPVTPGLFAAGYVQISGSGIYDGLQVTDSQG